FRRVKNPSHFARKIRLVRAARRALGSRAGKIFFVETEPSEQEFFVEALTGHDVAFASKLDDVAADAEILSTFINFRVEAAFLAPHAQTQFPRTRSTSTDHLDLAALHARDVSVARVMHYGETTVAEHTF